MGRHLGHYAGWSQDSPITGPQQGFRTSFCDEKGSKSTWSVSGFSDSCLVSTLGFRSRVWIPPSDATSVIWGILGHGLFKMLFASVEICWGSAGL